MNKKISVLLVGYILSQLLLVACQQLKSASGNQLEIATGPAFLKTQEYVEGGASSVADQTINTSQDQITAFDVYENVDPSGQNIVFWHGYSPYFQEALDKIITDFNSSNPWGITVTAQNKGSLSDLYDQMLGAVNTTEAPAVVSAYQDQAADYFQVGGLVNINELINSTKWGLSDSEKSDFYPGIFNHDIFPTYENARLGFPVSRSMHVLYINQEWLAELGYSFPPASPEEFVEMACKASNQPFSKAIGGETTGYGLVIDASILADWFFAHSGNIYDYESNHYSFVNEGAVAALQFLQELILRRCAEITAERYGGEINFGAGKQLFELNSTSAMPYIQDAVDDGAQFKWSISPIPYTGETPRQNTIGPSLSIPRTSPEIELAAWLFVRHFASPAVQAEWAAATGYLPVRRSAIDRMQQFLLENPIYRSAVDLLAYSEFEPPVPGYNFVREIIEEALAAVIKGAKIMPILEELNDEANTILAEQPAALLKIPAPAPPVEPVPVPLGSIGHPIKILFAPSFDDKSLVSSSDQIEQDLQQATGLVFEASVYTSSAAAVEAMCASPGDTVAFLSAVGYILANQFCGIEPAISLYPAEWNERFTQFISQRASNIQSLADLEGKKWGLSERTSPTAYFHPLVLLNELGITPGTVVETGSYPATVRAVYNGDVEFGTVYFNPPVLPEGTWQFGDPPDIPNDLIGNCSADENGELYCAGYQVMDARQTIIQEAPDVIQKVRILDITREIPNDTMSFSAEFPDDLKPTIMETVIAYIQDEACQQTLCSPNIFGWTGTSPVSDDNFDSIRLMMQTQGITLENIDG